MSKQKSKPSRLSRAVGRSIKHFRSKRAFSQAKLAQASGCHAVFLSNVERGRYVPNVVVVMSIEQALDLKPGTIIAFARLIIDHVERLAAERSVPKPAPAHIIRPAATDQAVRQATADAEAAASSAVVDLDGLARELEA